jgi:glycosyltransferase involved in cell wall biosynthesis
MESQILGTPVIGAKIGGIPELIKENETGLLFAPGNAEELLEKLRYLLKTPGGLKTFTENCKGVSFETPETYYEKLIKLYGDN